MNLRYSISSLGREKTSQTQPFPKWTNLPLLADGKSILQLISPNALKLSLTTLIFSHSTSHLLGNPNDFLKHIFKTYSKSNHFSFASLFSSWSKPPSPLAGMTTVAPQLVSLYLPLTPCSLFSTQKREMFFTLKADHVSLRFDVSAFQTKPRVLAIYSWWGNTDSYTAQSVFKWNDKIKNTSACNDSGIPQPDTFWKN